jgi:hypothetical protein
VQEDNWVYINKDETGESDTKIQKEKKKKKKDVVVHGSPFSKS